MGAAPTSYHLGVPCLTVGRVPDRYRMPGCRCSPTATRSVAWFVRRPEVDSSSRLLCFEQLTDERRETAAGFWERAGAFFAEPGVEVTAVVTDNGAATDPVPSKSPSTRA